jgi:NADH-quinone oxidoreductase subunit E
VSIACIDDILARHPAAGRSDLIPILQEVQQAEGYVPREAVLEIGRRLNLPASKIYGVATFYNQFRFERPGQFQIQLCRGTACHVKGSAKLLEAIRQVLAIGPGEVTSDGVFGLEVVACVGACGLAPVMVVDGNFHAGVRPEDVKGILDSYRAKAVGDDSDAEN